jgi:hypothetical protein
MKKTYLLILLVFVNFLSIASTYDFLKNNEVNLIIRKAYEDITTRTYPKEEYYISDNSKILYVEYQDNIDARKKGFNYYFKREAEHELPYEMRMKLFQTLKNLKNKDLFELDIKLENKLKYFHSLLDYTDGQRPEYKIAGKEVDFKELYILEFEYNSEDIVFILGDIPTAYEDIDIQNFVISLNEINTFIKEKENKFDDRGIPIYPRERK